MGRDSAVSPAVRMGARARHCQRPGCGRIHFNAQYCSRRCTAIVTRSRQSPERRSEIAKRGRMKQFRGEVFRMLQRVKVLGNTVDEQIVLAWRYGKGAAKSQRYRVKQAVSGAADRIRE